MMLKFTVDGFIKKGGKTAIRIRVPGGQIEAKHRVICLKPTIMIICKL